MTEILLLTCLFLFAGAVAVPIASKLQLGSVLGYIIAGMLISPVLHSLHVDVITLQHFAEFGVVMMLFLVGLELEPKLLWEMRSRLLGLGGIQVFATITLVTLVALALGQSFNQALAIGFVITMSSTAIVLQTLNEKRLMQSEGGQSSFSVLLFQDIAVIPMLAILPVLAVTGHHDAAIVASEAAHQASSGDHGAGFSLVKGLSGWAQALVTIGAIVLVVFVGVVVSRPFFRFTAEAKLRETLVAAALFWVVGIAALMILVDLSPALGTFLAGVILANSEYRHELESNIEPFKGLLLGLFFITVGSSIDFSLLFRELDTVLLLTFGAMLLKVLVLFGLTVAFKIQGGDRWLFALGLAQVGEFAFVLLSFATVNHVLPNETADLLLLVVALSMLLTPAAFIIQQNFLAGGTDEERSPDDVTEQHPIIIAGHGRVGGVVNRMLRGLGYQTTVLDYNSSHLERLRKFNFRVFFGDATRPELLHAAGIANAKLFIVTIDDRQAITNLVHYVHSNYPKVHIIARAVERHHVYELYAAGCRDIIRETFDSSVRIGRSALEAMGIHAFEAELKTRKFVEIDKAGLIELAPLYKSDVPTHEIPEYVEKALEIAEKNDALLQGQGRQFSSRADRGWTPPKIRDAESELRN